jgi:hypothetical protein
MAPDGVVDNPDSRLVIIVFEVAMVGAGLGVLLLRDRIPGPLARLLVVPLLAVVALGAYGTALALNGPSERQARMAQLDRSEQLYKLLSPRVSLLDKSVLNLELPDAGSSPLFAQTVATSGSLSDVSGLRTQAGPAEVTLYEWPIEPHTESVASRDMRVWRPFFDQVDYLSYATFVLVRGTFTNPGETEWRSVLGFSGLARLVSGKVAQVSAEVDALWARDPSVADPGDGSSWHILTWHTVKFAIGEAPILLFEETLDRAIPDPVLRARARTSIQEQLIVKNFREKVRPNEYFTYQALDRHPGLAVVDIDGDGLDDLYVMPLEGKNMLLHNEGNGTFKDIAPALGLDYDHTSSAIFADFKNDGHLGVFLGRTLERSVYLVKEGDRFVDRSKDFVDVPLPYLVSSVSAADYDGDGLLDVYFSTYASDMFFEHPDSPEKFLTPEQAREFRQRLRDSHWLQSRVGPPSLLLQNKGNGRFGLAPASKQVEVWRNTYEATWADVDGDGRPDLYVVNDFGTNNLFHNEGGGHFSDVTAQAGVADLGFGMGASFGDYDNDGQPDLYVSNMYSKAGQRILDFLGPDGAEFKPMARGNSLFHNEHGRFERVSGTKPPAVMVEKAGWSWGSQFVDVDNDGFLDIYALSGYYTAPREIAIPVDT